MNFDEYLADLCIALGHIDRHEGFKTYCQQLLLKISRKNVKSLAQKKDYQKLHHTVAKSEWSDSKLLARVYEQVKPIIDIDKTYCWIISEINHPRSTNKPAGAELDEKSSLNRKTVSSQTAVSLSLATKVRSLPLSYRLFIPEDWFEVNDKSRSNKIKISNGKFKGKAEIVLEQVKMALKMGVSRDCIVGADICYGGNQDFRHQLTKLELPYILAVNGDTPVWEDGNISPDKTSGTESVRSLAVRKCTTGSISPKGSLNGNIYRKVSWLAGESTRLESSFAVVHVSVPVKKNLDPLMIRNELLLIEWPEEADEPTHFWLSSMPKQSNIRHLVQLAKMPWRTEQDFKTLKRDYGLMDYEGRSWRGFHHHATLCIATYAYNHLICRQIKPKAKR